MPGARTVALVPLRGGSKGIRNKNIRSLAGKPLCAWVLEAATLTAGIDAVYVSTDSGEIASTVASLDLGVHVIDRPAELASDTASTEAVMMHFMAQVDFGTLVTIQATSPLLTCHDLSRALGIWKQGNLDSMVSVVRCHHFLWSENGEPLNYDPNQRPRRQDWNGVLVENGAFYITGKSILENAGCRLGGRIGLHEMSARTLYEIDTPDDWLIVEELLKAQHNDY